MICEELKGKKVLVTGSSSGIGQATAILFARQGCIVGIHYFRTQDGAYETLRQVKQYSQGFMLRADIRKKKQVFSMVKEFASRAGGIDILVNNAGTLIDRKPLESAPLSFFEDVFATNTTSVFLTTQAALPYLKQSRGNIVNVGSVAGQDGGGNGSGIYAAAKATVHTLTMAMAKEFAKYGIRVNSVLPGSIDTRFHHIFSSAERRRRMA